MEEKKKERKREWLKPSYKSLKFSYTFSGHIGGRSEGDCYATGLGGQTCGTS